MKTLLTAIIGVFLSAAIVVAQTTAPAPPVTCAALIKQFDDKTKTIKASDEAKKLRAQAKADDKAKKEADCNKNIQAAIKTLGK
jgi:tripartite-type tricarboxylate transporter receptor subunit TctC